MENQEGVIGPAQLVDRCPHCFQRTALDVRATYEYEAGEEHPGSGFMYRRVWRLLQCISCERPIVHAVLWSEIDPEGEMTTMVHPSAAERSLEGLPENVSQAYDACLKVQRVDSNAYAVLVGRLLEVIAVEEGFGGRRLVDQLRQLADQGKIPPTLAEMADQLRQIRNLGAHAQAGEVSQSDVPVIADFADAIVEYLYRAPAKVQALKARLDQQKKGS